MKSRGSTLIELVASIVIISTALMGTLISINTASIYSANPLLIQQATAIASSYLDEIASKLFVNGSCPAPSGGLISSASGRASATHLCQYNGLSQAPTDQNGTLVSGLGAYTVTVTINFSTANLGTLTTAAKVNRIDVTVTHPNMSAVLLSAYRTNY